MTPGERVDLLVRTLSGNNAKMFSERTGISPSILSRIRSGELKFTKRVDAILTAYPAVNRQWLETGEGYPGDIDVDMTRNHYLGIIEKRDKLIETLRREIEIQQRIIEERL